MEVQKRAPQRQALLVINCFLSFVCRLIFFFRGASLHQKLEAREGQD